jgi:hypothetical protein
MFTGSDGLVKACLFKDLRVAKRTNWDQSVIAWNLRNFFVAIHFYSHVVPHHCTSLT